MHAKIRAATRISLPRLLSREGKESLLAAGTKSDASVDLTGKRRCFILEPLLVEGSLFLFLILFFSKSHSRGELG
jgi:hypothetical protein